jgi:peroxiredoxin/uncharacterized membrane protein YphA (DoxX/SURF4 family)
MPDHLAWHGEASATKEKAMEIALLVIRLVLAAVFLVAGLAKLADVAGSQQALRNFGVPARLSGPFGVLLPLAELVVVVALLPSASAWWGAVGALVLLLVFVTGIGYNLTRGRTPDCHCFGQLHSAPAGWPTLTRNLLLAALAGLVVGFGRGHVGLSTLDWIGAWTVSQRLELLGFLILFALLIGTGWLLFHILRQQGRLLLRIEALEAQVAAHGMATVPARSTPSVPGLPVGRPAPPFDLSTFTGEQMTLNALRALGKPVVLLFSDPGCDPCTVLLPEIGRWQREYAAKVVVALISRGTAEATRPKVTEYGLTHVLLQQDREVAQAYQTSGTPSAVLIRRDGTIGSPAAAGADAIRGLIAGVIGLPMAAAASQRNGNGATATPRPPAEPRIGDAAPEFSLPDLSGNIIQLSDFRGHQVLVLFWRPSCGFCQLMLPDLLAWEAQPPEGAPRLLVVSTGSVQDNQALGLRSPVVLDQAGMSIASRFGAVGTPMAVLVDAEGRIASEIEAGAPAVLALASGGQEKSAPVK